MKNYIGFVNDHSGSMHSLTQAAIKDYNANINGTRDGANAEMLDTVVSVVAIGGTVNRQVTISNPHVLRPITTWRASGGTPLFTGLLDIIEMHEKLPDADKEDVSFLIMATTDGEATDTYKRDALRAKIADKLRTGRWTFVFRVPRGGSLYQWTDCLSSSVLEWNTVELSSDPRCRSGLLSGSEREAVWLYNKTNVLAPSFWSAGPNRRSRTLMSITINLTNIELKLTPKDIEGLITEAVEKANPTYKVDSVKLDTKLREAGVAWNSYSEAVFEGAIVKLSQRKSVK